MLASGRHQVDRGFDTAGPPQDAAPAGFVAWQFRLLHQPNPQASPAERQREGLAFTAPVLVYPQTLITQKDAPGFVNGKPAFQRLGAVDGTTNMMLARQIQKSMPDLVVTPFTGSGAHEKMLEALFETREIDGGLVDKPLAVKKIKSFQGNEADVEYNATDIREIDGKPVDPERIGFVLRPGDKALREALDREIAEGRNDASDRQLSFLVDA